MSRPNYKQRSFSILEFSFWATCATYYPFLVVYLRTLGYSNTIIGTILAVNSFTAIIAQIFWGIVSDWLQSVKKVFMLCLGGAIVLLITLPFYSSALITGIILAAVTFFESSLPPLLDSWVIQNAKSNPSFSYGMVRLWGSIGFATVAYVTGKITDIITIKIIFPAYAILGLLTILLCTGIKFDRPATSVPLKNLKVGRLLKNYYYVTFLVFAIVLFIPHRSAFIFLPNLMEQLGGDMEEFGMSFSVMAFSEVPVFLLSARLFKKFKPVHLILISTVFFMLRQILYSIATAPVHIILSQLLQGPSYALFLAGTVYYLDSLAPPELKSTAQTLASSIFFGISGVIGSYGGGWFIDHFGLIRMYHIGFIVTIVISCLFLLSLVYRKHQNRGNAPFN